MIILFLLLDYIGLVGAEQSAVLLRDLCMGDSRGLHISWLNFWFVFPVLYLVFMHIGQLYSRQRPFYREIEHIFYGCCYGTVGLTFVLYVAQRAATTSRLFVGLLAILAFIYIVLLRYLVKRWLRGHHFLQQPVLIIGAGKTAELLAHAIEGDVGLGYHIVGLLEDRQVQPGILEKYPVLGAFAEAEQVIARTQVRNVFIAAPGLEEKKLASLIYRVQPLVENTCVIPNLVGVPTGGVEIERMFKEKMLVLRLRNNLARPLNRWGKTIFDYTLTILGTIAISPILLCIALWIYKDSPGPIIFKHIRIGKDGKPFPCYKFRTMCVDAKERLAELLESDPEARAEWERDFKLKNDPRITRSGAFLRKTSLDELPQIFNVLKGEMSLVGPRPIIEEELARYGDYVADYLMVKPGITGMWQVSGRSDIDYTERVLLDSWYVRNWSVWVDIMLLYRTFAVVLEKKGAY